MTEKELVEMMYHKHKKLLLTAKEAAAEWGSSYSALSKLFGGKESLPDEIILEKQIIPKWVPFGQKRKWKITEIAKWILNTKKEKGHHDK